MSMASNNNKLFGALMIIDSYYVLSKVLLPNFVKILLSLWNPLAGDDGGCRLHSSKRYSLWLSFREIDLTGVSAPATWCKSLCKAAETSPN